MAAAEQFVSASKRWAKFDEKTGPLGAIIVDLAKHFDQSSNYSDATKRRNIQHMQKSLKNLVKLENMATAHGAACERAAQQVSADLDADVSAVFNAEASKATQTAARSRTSHDPRVKAVAQLLGGDTGDEDEVQAVGERLQSTCPVLATPLVNPLRNTGCGHVYSYQGALQLLLQRLPPGSKFTAIDQIPAATSVRCPVAGCNKNFTPRTLKRDYAVEHLQRLRTATSRQDDDDDEEIDMIL